MSAARDRLAAALGVQPSYEDATGTRHDLKPDTRDALLAGFGVRDDAEVEARLKDIEADRILPLWQVVEAGAEVTLPALEGREWVLYPEDGEEETRHGTALGSVSAGIHRIEVEEETSWLLAAPERLPEPPRAWGVTLPLYGLSGDGRIGTYADLGRAAQSLGQAGAAFAGINPVHAGFVGDTDAFSPYAPSHRGRLSVLHVTPDTEGALPGGDLLDYDHAIPHRMDALRASFATSDAFETWRADAGPELERFALHQALSTEHGPYWTDWPEALHDPSGEAAQAFRDDRPQEVTFNAWLQWRAEQGLEEAQTTALEAGMRFGLYLDLAVGTHPKGAETWGMPGLFAQGVSLGAPPDAFSAEGQSWGLAPLRPDALAEAGFRPLQAILRRALSNAKLLRIDHILGFERAFWAPEAQGVPGGYVAMPREALFAVVRIEAARAGATIVGEDLGNIPEGLGEAMAESGILGCRVTQFERHWDRPGQPFRAARDYDRAVLTSWGSHDLPTWEGWKQGCDIDWRRDVGDIDEDAHARALEERQLSIVALEQMVGDLSLDALHRFLAETPSRLVVAQIEDLLGRVEQANLPGTVHAHPNWRRRLDPAPDGLGSLDAVSDTAIIMREADRQDVSWKN